MKAPGGILGRGSYSGEAMVYFGIFR